MSIVKGMMRFKIMNKRAAFVALETLMVILVILAIGIGFAAWRLLSGPVEIDFAKPYILSSLRDDGTGAHASMDRLVLQWPDMRGPILLGMKNSRFYDGQGQVVASVDEAALGLSKRYLAFGQVVPVALILKNPTLRIVRHEDNSFDAGLVQGVDSKAPPAVAPKPGGGPLDKVVGWLAHPGRDPHEPNFLRGLKAFEIEGAKVIVDDALLDMSWTLPQLDIQMERQPEGLLSKAFIRFDDSASAPSILKVETLLDSKSGEFSGAALLEHFELSLLGGRIPELSVLKQHKGQLDARLNFVIGADRTVKSAKMTLLSGKGELNIPELSEKPVPFSDMGLVAEYNGENDKLQVSGAEMTLNGSVSVRSAGALVFSENGFDGDMKFMIDRLAQADIAPVWPEILKGDASEKWIVRNLSDGVFSDLQAVVGLRGQREGEDWHFDITSAAAQFAFEGMSIDYRNPLAPIRDAQGRGHFDLGSETLRIDIESAKLLDMQISKADVELVNIIEGGKGVADLNVVLSGPLKSALTYVKDEPISVNTLIDIEKTQGQADIAVNLAFPAHADLKVADVKINITGEMTDVVLPGVVRDLTLTAEKLTLSAADNVFSVSGAGKLEGRDIKLDYQEFLNAEGQAYTSKVKASLVADSEIRKRMGMDLGAFLEGQAAVDVVYTQYANGKSEAEVAADLRDVRLFFDPFGYDKAPGKPGNVTLLAVLKDGDLKEIKGLKGTASNLLIES
ncbi:MAG: hypothetical protein IT559_04270, partial [Alphaproteobacteria bacterium]|nr:hypothetical protein [Alphaproteobacteria bacterium]